MFITLLPKNIEALIRKLWRQGHNQGNTMHLIAWETLVRLIQDDGLGLFNMEGFNKALIAKQLWNIVSNPHSLLAKLVIQKYGRGLIENISSHHFNSFWRWKPIVQVSNIIIEHLRWQVVDGYNINLPSKFWWKMPND